MATHSADMLDDRGAGPVGATPGAAVVSSSRLAARRVPVAFEVAKSLQAPLDVLVVRKRRAFQQLAFGAIGEDGVRVLSNDDVVRGTHLRCCRHGRGSNASS